jgi:hypothetical protein
MSTLPRGTGYYGTIVTRFWGTRDDEMSTLPPGTGQSAYPYIISLLLSSGSILTSKRLPG